MDFDAITSFLEDFDASAFIPELNTVLGRLELVMRIAVLIGPLALMALGLMYFLVPPKEANHSFGYRFFWGMSSVEAWQFTQRVAGIAWGSLGLILVIVMAVVCNGFRGLESMAMVWAGVRCILWELGLLALSCLVIDILVVVFFDRKGVRRQFGRNREKAPEELDPEAFDQEDV